MNLPPLLAARQYRQSATLRRPALRLNHVRGLATALAILAATSPHRAQEIHVHIRGMDMTGIEFGQPPPAESAAQLRLDTSLRLGEFLDVPMGDGAALRAWVVYPLRNGKGPSVIVLHESAGLTDWTRAVADQAAAEGYIAVAPDLVPTSPGENSDDPAENMRRLAALTSDELRARLDAVRLFASRLPVSNGKVGVLGFGWGGTAAFDYATREPSLGAAVIFYGQSPELPRLATITAPVLGLYAQGDTADVRMAASTATEMRRLKKTFQSQVYKGALGPFLRDQEGGKDGANEVASVEAWLTTFSFFRKHLGK